MSTKVFVIVVVVVAALLAAVVYMHRPRTRAASTSSFVHGGR
jgi:preprotein translocase subunit SecG